MRLLLLLLLLTCSPVFAQLPQSGVPLQRFISSTSGSYTIRDTLSSSRVLAFAPYRMFGIEGVLIATVGSGDSITMVQWYHGQSLGMSELFTSTARYPKKPFAKWAAGMASDLPPATFDRIADSLQLSLHVAPTQWEQTITWDLGVRDLSVSMKDGALLITDSFDPNTKAAATKLGFQPSKRPRPTKRG